jgi:predicted transcriptional regulator
VSDLTNPIAARSLSRRILLRLLVVHTDLSRHALASRLAIAESRLGDYESGQRLMPLDVQERLAVLAFAEEPRLRRLARQLQLQVQAARRYQAGEVVRHMTSPP